MHEMHVLSHEVFVAQHISTCLCPSETFLLAIAHNFWGDRHNQSHSLSEAGRSTTVRVSQQERSVCIS